MYNADDDDEKGNFSARDAPTVRNEELSTRVGDDALDPTGNGSTCRPLWSGRYD